MKKTLITGAITATIVAAPAFAQRSSQIDEVLTELRALSQRVEKLEQDKTKLESENAELKAQNDRLEATTEYLRSNATATRKELAQDSVNIEKSAEHTKASEWASKITWKGDARYRHENIDAQEAVTDRDRQRIRARFGLTAKVTDTVAATIALATNGGLNDPRSTNQTLGNGFDRKGVAIDQAFIDWKPVEGFNVLLGKMPQPWQRVGNYFWDGDITPEGGALKFARGAFFGTAFGYWLSERSTAAEATLSGAQLGFKTDVGAAKFTAAVGYFDVGAVQNKVTTLTDECSPITAFFEGPQGNTTLTDADGCSRLLNDYNMLEALGQVELMAGKFPFTVFASYIQNQEADELDTGYSAGFTFGKAGDARTWELGYAYQSMEKDAQFGQFVDSDFGGGVTDTQGSAIRIGFAPMKNWILNGTYFLNDRFVDAGTESDYKRYQLDLNYKF